MKRNTAGGLFGKLSSFEHVYLSVVGLLGFASVEDDISTHACRLTYALTRVNRIDDGIGHD